MKSHLLHFNFSCVVGIKIHKALLFFVIGAIVVTGCATYYEKNIVYHQHIQNSDFGAAEKTLDHAKVLKRNRNQLLLALEKGKLAHVQGAYTISNQFFNEADLLMEDYKKSLGDHALGVTVNPQLEVYGGEDFEKVLVHYYKALNYLYLGDQDAALVEAKRINLQLQELNDQYKNVKNKYAQDAFALNLMGIIYESRGDYNNAFIAYRNAIQCYMVDGVVGSYMNVSAPLQLKKDVIRTAQQMGFSNEARKYSELFGLPLNELTRADKEVIVFWENGLVPTKEEWSLNFTLIPGSNGIVTFVNKEYNLSFPFPMKNNQQGLAGVSAMRIAFPKYKDRISFYTDVTIELDGKEYKTELVEDVGYIARETLQDRFMREMSNSLMRLAMKKAAEMAVREQSQELGAVLSIIGAATEKADTRHWQTLPKEIRYARIPVSDDSQKLTLRTKSSSTIKNIDVLIPKSNNRINFIDVHTMTVRQNYY